MAPKIKLYMFTGSAPSLTAALMLEHKELEHKRVHVLVGPHAFGMLARGFDTMTVPAMKIDGRRVQGSRELSRALDEVRPARPLLPLQPERRATVTAAERAGEELQDVVRRLVLWAARRDPRVFRCVYAHPSLLMRPVQRMSRRVVIRLASAAHRATDRACEEDLAGLRVRLDQVDAWIAEGLLDSSEPNAADFQFAPNLALLLRFADLAPLVEGRAAARLAQRWFPEGGDTIDSVLPASWLASASAVAPLVDPATPQTPAHSSELEHADAQREPAWKAYLRNG